MKIKLLKYDVFNQNSVDTGIPAFRISHYKRQYPDPENCRNIRNFFKLTFIESGRAFMHCTSGKIALEPGMIYCVHPDDPTSYEITEEAFTVCNILFQKACVPCAEEVKDLGGFFRLFREDCRIFSVNAFPAGREGESLVMRLLREQHNPGADSQLYKKILLQELLLLTARICRKKTPSLRSSEIVSFVLNEIEKHLQDHFDIALAAEKLNITKNHLCMVFRKNTGKNITEYLIGRRLSESEKLLVNEELSISEIAYHCGFNDLSYFYRAFRRRYGMNPGTRRKLLCES